MNIPKSNDHSYWSYLIYLEIPPNFFFFFFFVIYWLIRRSRSQMFFKIVFLKDFIIFTGKHLCWSLSLIKLLAWRDSNTGVFLWILHNFSEQCFSQNISDGCFWPINNQYFSNKETSQFNWIPFQISWVVSIWEEFFVNGLWFLYEKNFLLTG